MLFNLTVEYALRVVVCMAESPDTPKTSGDLTKMTHVPANYLSKLMQTLRKHQLVTGKRGMGGGFLLTKAPEEITILDVFDIVDPIARIEQCPLGIKSHNDCLCPVHRCLDDAIAHVQDFFRRTTIADLLKENSPARPLCNLKQKRPE